MKVKLIKEKIEEFDNKPFSFIDILDDKVYEVVEISKRGEYRIIDESGEDYLYNSKAFEVVED